MLQPLFDPDYEWVGVKIEHSTDKGMTAYITKSNLYSIPTWTHDAEPPHARAALVDHYLGFKTCLAPEQKCCLPPEQTAQPRDVHYSLYPTSLRGGLHRFSVPQETRFPLINPNSRLYTSTEQTLIHIQQAPLPLTVAGSRYCTGQLCFFNGRSLETLVQNNYYCNKA